MFRGVARRYVRTAVEWDEAWGRVKDQEWFGFDVEKGENGGAKVLQLATAKEAIVVHIAHLATLPESLKTMLEDPDIFKIGVGVHEDLMELKKSHKVKGDGAVDIAWVAYVIGATAEYRGLNYLAEHLLGETKEENKGRWENTRLDEKQLEYAAKDAWLGLAIAERVYADSLTKREKDKISMSQWLAMVRTTKSDIDEYVQDMQDGSQDAMDEDEDPSGKLRAIAQAKRYSNRLTREVAEQIKRLEKDVAEKKPRPASKQPRHITQADVDLVLNVI